MGDEEAYAESLCLLRRRQSVVDDAGTRIEVKSASAADQEGGLDARVLSLLAGRAPAPMFPHSSDREAFDPASLDVAGIRAAMGWPNRDLTTGGVQTIERTIPGREPPIRARIYSPEIAGEKPAVVFFHGGAFLGGSMRTVENPCKTLAERAGALVASVDYRLAPEHPFPAGLVDCFSAVAWVHANAAALDVDERRIVVADASRLAPALIVTAEYDALRPEAEVFARMLTRAGVRARVIRYAGMEHAFLDKLGFYPQAEDCIDEIAAEVRRLPHRGT